MTQWLDWRRMFARHKEKIEITVETRESWEVRWFRQSRAELCPICRAETIFIPVEIAAQVTQTDEAAVGNLLEGGQIHGETTPDGERLICLSSLKKAVVKDSTQRFLKEE